MQHGTNMYAYDGCVPGGPDNGKGNGNVTAGGGRINAWDSQNRLVSCQYQGKTSTFTYGADGLRRSMTVNDGTSSKTTHFMLDGQMVVRELQEDAQGQLLLKATYMVGARGPECRIDEDSGSTKWYVYDGLGSVLTEVDDNGEVTTGWTDNQNQFHPTLRSYDAFGVERNTLPQNGTSDHKFVGQLGHSSGDGTGLIYMGARYYDPVVGRFVSEDRQKDGVNWYAYCDNNPVNLVDQSGEAPSVLEATLTIVGLLFGVAGSSAFRHVFMSSQALLSGLIGMASGVMFFPGMVVAASGILFAAEACSVLENTWDAYKTGRITKEWGEVTRFKMAREAFDFVSGTIALCNLLTWSALYE